METISEEKENGEPVKEDLADHFILEELEDSSDLALCSKLNVKCWRLACKHHEFPHIVFHYSQKAPKICVTCFIQRNEKKFVRCQHIDFFNEQKSWEFDKLIFPTDREEIRRVRYLCMKLYDHFMYRRDCAMLQNIQYVYDDLVEDTAKLDPIMRDAIGTYDYMTAPSAYDRSELIKIQQYWPILYKALVERTSAFEIMVKFDRFRFFQDMEVERCLKENVELEVAVRKLNKEFQPSEEGEEEESVEDTPKDVYESLEDTEKESS